MPKNPDKPDKDKKEDQGLKQQMVSNLRAEAGKKGIAFKMFLDMVLSFDEIIPEEHKRYQAALKAVKQTGDMDVPMILEAADLQLAELLKQREKFLDGFREKRSEVRFHEEKVREVRAEISDLKSRIEGLENVERTLLSRIEDQRKEITLQEETFDSAMKAVQKEIAELKEKISVFTAKTAAAVPEAAVKPASAAPEPSEHEPSEHEDEPDTNEDPEELSDEALRLGDPFGAPILRKSYKAPASTPSEEKKKNSAFVKTCPNCKGEMSYYDIYKRWVCYVCGYQEDNK